MSFDYIIWYMNINISFIMYYIGIENMPPDEETMDYSAGIRICCPKNRDYRPLMRKGSGPRTMARSKNASLCEGT
jgi:hypothetical protein